MGCSPDWYVGYAGCSPTGERSTRFSRLVGNAVIWSYFDNSATSDQPGFAIRALAQPIYRDVGATIPT